MNRLLPLVLLLPAAACTAPGDTHDGTAVGNPGVVAFALGELDGIDVHAAEAGAMSAAVQSCGGATTEDLELAEPIPLDGDVAFDLPQGTWCSLLIDGLELGMEGQHSDAPSEDDGLLFMMLSVGDLAVSAPTFDGFTVTADEAFVLELGSPGWLGADDVALEAESEVIIDGDSALHTGIVELIVDQSALYEDPNTDSVVNDEERDTGATAESANEIPTPPDPDVDGGGAACAQQGPSDGTGWMLVAVMALLRRRRTQRP